MSRCHWSNTNHQQERLRERRSKKVGELGLRDENRVFPRSGDSQKGPRSWVAKKTGPMIARTMAANHLMAKRLRRAVVVGGDRMTRTMKVWMAMRRVEKAEETSPSWIKTPWVTQTDEFKIRSSDAWAKFNEKPRAWTQSDNNKSKNTTVHRQTWDHRWERPEREARKKKIWSEMRLNQSDHRGGVGVKERTYKLQIDFLKTSYKTLLNKSHVGFDLDPNFEFDNKIEFQSREM